MADFENPILSILCDAEPPVRWLIPELFLQGTQVVLAGGAGAGKSYVSYYIALAIAAGIQAMGGIVPAGEPKVVLYFDEENSEQDRNKYIRRCWNGLMKENKITDPFPYYERLVENFWPMNFHLGAPDWKDRAFECIENIVAIRGQSPHMMVFDTATPAFNIEDENSNSEATKATKGVRELQLVCDPVATATILKHAKFKVEGERRTIRGAKAWLGAVDGVIFQVKATGRPRSDGLALTRLEPDKTRAYGLSRTVYITPRWTDNAEKKTGLLLFGSYEASKEHKLADKKKGSDEDDE
jgi:hypothetical protein